HSSFLPLFLSVLSSVCVSVSLPSAPLLCSGSWLASRSLEGSEVAGVRWSLEVHAAVGSARRRRCAAVGCAARIRAAVRGAVRWRW
ncbi:hypothetical protein VIGAN_07075800, partial [Vigna angularis var. angularis]